MFEENSEALPGFFITLIANFLPALAELLPEFLKKLPNPFATVLSETVTDFVLFHNEQCPINTLLTLEVISPRIFVVPDLYFPPTQLLFISNFWKLIY